jgi:hypothetical protein
MKRAEKINIKWNVFHKTAGYNPSSNRKVMTELQISLVSDFYVTTGKKSESKKEWIARMCS